jgi:hypothetical protein
VFFVLLRISFDVPDIPISLKAGPQAIHGIEIPYIRSSPDPTTYDPENTKACKSCFLPNTLRYFAFMEISVIGYTKVRINQEK